jgi:hypothetical protein
MFSILLEAGRGKEIESVPAPGNNLLLLRSNQMKIIKGKHDMIIGRG